MKKHNVNEMASIFIQAAKKKHPENQLNLFEREKSKPTTSAPSTGVSIKDVFNQEIDRKRLGTHFPKEINYNNEEIKKIISKITQAFHIAQERIRYEFRFYYPGYTSLDTNELEKFIKLNQFYEMSSGESKLIYLPIIKLRHISIEEGAKFEPINYRFKCVIEKIKPTDYQLEIGRSNDCRIYFICE